MPSVGRRWRQSEGASQCREVKGPVHSEAWGNLNGHILFVMYNSEAEWSGVSGGEFIRSAGP